MFTRLWFGFCPISYQFEHFTITPQPFYVFCAPASESLTDAETVSEQPLPPAGETKTTNSDCESSDSSESEEEKKEEEEETKTEQEVSREHHIRHITDLVLTDTLIHRHGTHMAAAA